MRIGALIPVRLASERLPNKALLPIAGRPMITHLLDRVFASRHLTRDRVVVCTTEEKSDDPLVSVVEATGARIFRGSRDDIVDRFYRAVQWAGFDAVIQADGDDPCADPLYMDLCMDRLLIEGSLGIVVAEGLPLGLASKAIRTSAIETVWKHHVTERNDTGFILYFTRTGLCKKDTIYPISPDHQHETARLTLDYPDDLTFFRTLFKELYREEEIFGVEQIVSLLRRRPDLVTINAGLSVEYSQRTRERAQLEYRVAGKAYKVEV
jgi:spore coat polysaccharide biosynthesis protein SpsF